MVEINSETDFAARDTNFQQFAELVVNTTLASKTSTVEKLSNLMVYGTKTIEDARQALIAKIGENIHIRRLTFMESNHWIGHYVHGSRIGVLVEIAGGDTDLAKDISMHIAATNPLVIAPEQVPETEIKQEKEIYMAQAEKTGKPQNIIEKMVQGRVKKFLQEVSLLNQPFVKDPNIKINQLLKQKQAKVIQFVRFELGEGIEKQVQDFAAEVMAQVKTH